MRHTSLFLLLCVALFSKRTLAGNSYSPRVYLSGFSNQFLSVDECRTQYRWVDGNTKCWGSHNYRNCTGFRGLVLRCYDEVTQDILKNMTTEMARQPIRPIRVRLHDRPYLWTDVLVPIRKQIVLVDLRLCEDTRITGKLAQLEMSKVVDFKLFNCHNLDIRRNDFSKSPEIRVIRFDSVTISALEVNSFQDLEYLRMLSLDYLRYHDWNGLTRDKAYLWKLHCGCEFAWFRSFIAANPRLLEPGRQGAMYEIVPDLWESEPKEKFEMFIPVDCD
ncbi:uncharacterized protein LOC129592520 [Paramacrobiotus metropolitanus]|uniref:uncharacterized protein LOC129592520 n=1 Tax=Paramacrobiotus metropolitanus TaxID=2943436 RepID=UPI002445BD3B|nr:uncharacterized protein LOC129592520 [Paramacrobiotus metropolitanus]